MKIPYDMACEAKVSQKKARREFRKLWDKMEPGIPSYRVYDKPTIDQNSELYRQFARKLLLIATATKHQAQRR